MTTSLDTVRADLYAALSSVANNANVYKYPRVSYEYPAFVVWPRTMDVRPAMGDPRDVTIDVRIGAELMDDDSTGELLDGLVDTVAPALLSHSDWDVQPVEFGSELLADGRVVLWANIPVGVFT